MKSLFTFVSFGAVAVLIAPFRRTRKPQQPARMDAVTYAAMLAEAERIASPYRQHIIAQRGVTQADPGGEFPEVEALLERAGMLV